VVLEEGPYYRHGGYFYYYQGTTWSYSQSRGGPWVALPRDRYPKEVKFKGKGGADRRDDEKGRGGDDRRDDEKGKGEKRGHDERGKD